jgi:GNAT superfamily N-acetyltransferase
MSGVAVGVGAKGTGRFGPVSRRPSSDVVVSPLDPSVASAIPSVVELAGRALGWQPDEPNEALFRWKHLQNPFGTSPMWVAHVDGELAGFRTLLRWRWVDRAGQRLRAVRAVDTATDPRFQGQGIFRSLTMHAVEAMVDDGVDFVFNTPNSQSRPGYESMGWQVLGQVPIAAGPLSWRGATRMVRARTPADKWSMPVSFGAGADEVLADTEGVRALLETQPSSVGWQTDRSVDFLRWRYADAPLHYRAVLAGTSVEDGVALFRCRRRGAACELTLGDLLVPGNAIPARHALLRSVRHAARGAGVDYVIRVQRPLVSSAMVRLPAQGPTLTWRPLVRQLAPELSSWELTLGDIELF